MKKLKFSANSTCFYLDEIGNRRQKNNDRIEKKREKGCMHNKLEAFLKEIKMNKNASTITNLRFDIDGTQNSQPSGSKTMESIGDWFRKNNVS